MRYKEYGQIQELTILQKILPFDYFIVATRLNAAEVLAKLFLAALLENHE